MRVQRVPNVMSEMPASGSQKARVDRISTTFTATETWKCGTKVSNSVASVNMMFVLSQMTKPSADLEYGRVDLAQLFGSVIAMVHIRKQI